MDFYANDVQKETWNVAPEESEVQTALSYSDKEETVACLPLIPTLMHKINMLTSTISLKVNRYSSSNINIKQQWDT